MKIEQGGFYKMKTRRRFIVCYIDRVTKKHVEVVMCWENGKYFGAKSMPLEEFEKTVEMRVKPKCLK